jgi:hypothetical protein
MEADIRRYLVVIPFLYWQAVAAGAIMAGAAAMQV